LTQNGTKIINGTVIGNNGVSTNWNATRDQVLVMPVSTDFNLGNVWTVKEYNGNSIWEGTWIRRGTTNVFDAKWQNNKSGQRVEDIIEYKGVKNGKVTLYRRGNHGTYTVTLSDRGIVIINGTTSWSFYWEAEIK
jgi:hypothetical protein